nr:LRR receptor-like serine/threonine-protein kinase ERL1 [Ipomoea batatas]
MSLPTSSLLSQKKEIWGKKGHSFLHLLLFPLLCFLKIRSFADVAILDPVDFLALQVVQKSLDDLPGSNYFGSWDFTSNPCGFAGVFCDGDNVVALNLSDPKAGSPGLIGRIDSAIGKFFVLVEFSVVPRRIAGALPESL